VSWRFGLGIVLVAAAACSSFGSTPDEGVPAVPPAGPPDGALGADDGAPPGDGGQATATVVLPVVKTAASIAASGGTLFFTDNTSTAYTCLASACLPEPFAVTPGGAGSNWLFRRVAATAGYVGFVDSTCSSRNDRDAGEYLYARDGGAVWSHPVPCPIAVSTFGDDISFTNSGLVGATAADWSITRCDAQGHCGDVAGSDAAIPNAVLAFGVFVSGFAVAATTKGQLLRWAPPGSLADATTIANGGAPVGGLATDGADVYWFDARGVQACSPANCAATGRTISTDPTAKQITGDATGAYWTSAGSGLGDGKLFHAAPGAEATVLEKGLSAPDAIALDEGFVYWTDQPPGNAVSGAILRRPKP
jgi:hypothetical protein